MTRVPGLAGAALGIIVVALGGTTAAFAQNYRSAPAHIHGAALVNLVIDQTSLAVELRVPATDIIGFEREPTSEEEKSRVQNAIIMLEQLGTVLAVNGAGTCATLYEQAWFGSFTDADHEHDEANRHTEFSASFSAECSDLGSASSISFAVFDHFPDITEIHVQLIENGHARVVEITSDKPHLTLGGNS